MKSLKTLVIAAALSLGAVSAGHAQAPAAAPAEAPAATTVANPAPVAAPTAAPAATPATSEAAVPAGDATYVPMKPTPGIGQPIDAGIDFQPQVSPVGEQAYWFNHVILLPVITIITLIVLGLMLWAMFRYRAKANPVPSKTTHNTFIEIIWTAIPVLILAVIAVPSIRLLAQQYEPPKKEALTIKVTGYQWYWGYAYPDQGIGEYVSKMLTKEQADAAGEPHQLGVDNRMVVPVGRQVKLIITGADVIHSFAVPAFWTKMDAVPGRANETTFTANKVGVYYGQCSELCGVDHGYMPIAVEVLPVDKWEAWVRSKGGNPAGPVAAAPVAAAPTPAAAAPAATPAATTTEAAPAAAPAAAPVAKN
ncbi:MULTISPECIES: cytochrome c oxidase subunit II [unclassified Sphingopyxis]|jgi:cytochrome c oxidase subunit II|uniref:cytochrome c oxidase subunit II n=1 Tax=unclassified Sphingopyxis TaxID=2614943 RepID=UPI00286C9356|nr:MULTISPECIES: cytochrome c oxidase subunit II [unclassified Sphingopyxis]